MGISFTDFTGGSAKQNNFAINTGVSGNNVFTLDRAYDDGSYAITVTSGDTSFDIYAIGTDGSYVGYTNSNKINISDKFNKLVMLGLPNNDEIFFEYRGKVNVPLASGSVPAAGAYVSSVSISSLEDIDDTTTITGGNFANDVEVYFVGQSNTETAAKNIVVTSVNQLIATRPDSFDPNDSPYTIKVVNPGIPTPDGSNLFRLNNSVTAGTIPSWTTGSTVYYQLSTNTSIDLVAADTEISDIDYSIVSGTLPSGLSLDTETGAISGTFSGSANDGDSSNLTLRATDAGGNFIDKEIAFVANSAPSWNTAAGTLASAIIGTAYSANLLATAGAAGSSLTYSVVSGTLPSGLSLNANGAISGTPSQEESQTLTVRVEDEFGNQVDRTFLLEVFGAAEFIEITSNQTITLTRPFTAYIFGGGGGGGGSGNSGTGGGGGSGYLTIASISPGTYQATIGGGGAAGLYTGTVGGTGGPTSFGDFTSNGGSGGGATSNGYGGSGGSGGGGAASYGSTSGFGIGGFNGGNGGGGAKGAGTGSGVSLPTSDYLTENNLLIPGQRATTSNTAGGFYEGGSGAIGYGGNGVNGESATAFAGGGGGGGFNGASRRNGGEGGPGYILLVSS